MPELPEVEVLVRHLAPILPGRTVEQISILRPKVVYPDTPQTLATALMGQTFRQVRRRAKYLLFELSGSRQSPTNSTLLIGHLGMTGRMYLQPRDQPLPKHTAVVLHLGTELFLYEDTRYFGRLNLDVGALQSLGPEPLEAHFTAETLRDSLQRSNQAIKIRLLDQTVVAGMGNIYASESLFRAGISPRRPARKVDLAAAGRLVIAIQDVLQEAIQFGSTVPLGFAGTGRHNGLFYYGQAAGAVGDYAERLRVYDRAGLPCVHCATPIRRCVQAARSTYWCPRCQPR